MEDLRFIPVPFTDKRWRELKIHDYMKKSKDQTSIESYYMELASGQSTLIAGLNDDFAIVKVLPDGNLWISAAYATTGDPFIKYTQHFKELARRLNAEYIKWSSNRPAYRKGSGLTAIGDYEIESVIYSMKVIPIKLVPN